MNVDLIRAVFNEKAVDDRLIGGVNDFLWREPTAAFDADLWIEDTETNNGRRCEATLVGVGTPWGHSQSQ